jgi:chromosome segregation ATPase
MALQDRFAKKGAEWDEERQSLLLLNSQLDDQMQGLRQDKAQLSTRLDQHQETWERERLALQIQMNTLDNDLALQKTQGGSGLSSDNGQVGQLRTEVAELRQQRTAWEKERQAFQEQLERLQAERRSFPPQGVMGSGSSVDVAGQEAQELRRQLEETRQECQDLQRKLAAHDFQAEKERSALESEIEQLMERLLRVQRGPTR